jgi:methylase of polypeptide subunit release factors
MKRSIFSYLKKNFSKRPKDVDRLLISAFVEINKIAIKNNLFIKEYLIDETETSKRAMLGKFLDEIKKEQIRFNIETLIEFFEFVISPEDRIVTGAVYTPRKIREYIVKNCLNGIAGNFNQIRIADISCGCGGFLYSVVKEIKKRSGKTYYEIFNKNIFGLDIQEYSVTRSKLLLCLLAISDNEDRSEFKFNLFKGDALKFTWAGHVDNFTGFHAIVGNPPYVCSRNIPDSTRALLVNWSVCSTGHPDLYIPFFQIGLENLRPQGLLGFITMNSFFKSVNGRAVRKYFQEKKYRFRIIDFGVNQVFQSRSTYTCICLIKKQPSDYIEYYKADSATHLPDRRGDFGRLLYSQLDAMKGWNLQNNRLITLIESVGTPFGEKYKTRNGIATLKNDVYIFKPVSEDKEYYYLQNGSVYPIEKTICRDVINPNMFTVQSDINEIKEKIIFPYSIFEEGAEVYSEERLRMQYPNTYAYLETKKGILAKRDKGKAKKYEVWFAFGRNQSLELLQYKMLFPHISPHTPNFVIDTDENLIFYNGISVIGDSVEELLILQKLMKSRLFWFYIKNSSKPYASGYYSLSKNYIKNFGVFNFSKEDESLILGEENQTVLDTFFESKYGISLEGSEL